MSGFTENPYSSSASASRTACLVSTREPMEPPYCIAWLRIPNKVTPVPSTAGVPFNATAPSASILVFRAISALIRPAGSS